MPNKKPPRRAHKSSKPENDQKTGTKLNKKPGKKPEHKQEKSARKKPQGKMLKRRTSQHNKGENRHQSGTKRHRSSTVQQHQIRPESTELELEIVGLTEDGEPFAIPTNRDLAGDYPRILVDPAVTVSAGDVVWAVVVPDEANKPKHGGAVTQYIASVIDKSSPERADTHGRDSFLGVVHYEGAHHFVRALNRELSASQFMLPKGDETPEDSVVRVTAGKRPAKGATPVALQEVLGATLAGHESLIAIDNHKIPHEFSAEMMAEAKALPAFKWNAKEGREDLRKVPIVTIDGADSRDFDDAVWAEEWADAPGDAHGHHIVVAIADVAHYVQPHSVLDKEGFLRGNSTYFPDRVVPMLPERLSNDLCSLVPKQDRPVLAVHLYIDSKGTLRKFKFVRAVIHSHARLTYTQVQQALNGAPDDTTSALMQSTLQPLYAAYQTLIEARKARGAFDLDLPEPYIVADDDGTIHALESRERLDSHRLIEEIMILANVAAARALGEKGRGTLYRIHPEPSDTKLETLNSVLKTHNIKFTNSGPTGQDYQKLVNKLHGHDAAPILLKSVLQSQMQAKYDPDNIGHFGLNLSHYSHFTSPIRRFSDLIVHRALIKHLKLAGEGGLPPEDSKLQGTADHLNVTERRSQLAEWEARDRMMARFRESEVGDEFEATVISVQSFGVFVVLADGMTEGLLPMRQLGNDYYRYDEKSKKLIGRRTRKIFQVGTKLKVKLTEADPIAARLTFGLVS